MLKPYLLRTLRDEDGAATVDWVVLTGALLILGMLVVGAVARGVNDTSGGLGAVLTAGEVPAIRFQ